MVQSQTPNSVWHLLIQRVSCGQGSWSQDPDCAPVVYAQLFEGKKGIGELLVQQTEYQKSISLNTISTWERLFTDCWWSAIHTIRSPCCTPSETSDFLKGSTGARTDFAWIGVSWIVNFAAFAAFSYTLKCNLVILVIFKYFKMPFLPHSPPFL